MSALSERLEMLLVLRWLDAGAPEDGAVVVSLSETAKEVGLGGGRPELLRAMEALGELEGRGLVRVSWPAAAASEARVELGDDLRRDAQRLFRP
ncbi:MAG: hypothetical protein ACR2N6_04625 [Miltoncostaeaceae bacterium]